MSLGRGGAHEQQMAEASPSSRKLVEALSETGEATVTHPSLTTLKDLAADGLNRHVKALALAS